MPYLRQASNTNKGVAYKKHMIVAFGVAFVSALLLGLSARLPVELAVPLCVLFGITGAGSIICFFVVIAQWFENNY